MVALRARRYEPTDVSTPESVAAAFLDRDQNERAQEQARTKELFFTDLKCGPFGAQIKLRHNFGRRARWQVVDWKRDTAGGTNGLERFTDDGTTLTLLSYVAGVATLRLF